MDRSRSPASRSASGKSCQMSKKQTNTRPEGPSAQARLRVLIRDRFTCTYCGVKGTDAELHVDHIHPVSKGGSNHMSNLTTACRTCNSEKRDKVGVVPSLRQTGWLHMWLHTWRISPSTGEYGINLQGKVIGVEGGDVFVQTFSWLDGSPSEVMVLSKDFLRSKDVRLYADRRQMHEAYLDAERVYGEERRYQLMLAGFVD